MRRYYVHVVEDDIAYPDTEGVRAAGLGEVEQLASAAACDMALEALKGKKGTYAAQLLVEDELDRQLFTVSISCTLSSSRLV